jgi:hypothetical protein
MYRDDADKVDTHYLHSTVETETFPLVRVKELLLVWRFLRNDINIHRHSAKFFFLKKKRCQKFMEQAVMMSVTARH